MEFFGSSTKGGSCLWLKAINNCLRNRLTFFSSASLYSEMSANSKSVYITKISASIKLPSASIKLSMPSLPSASIKLSTSFSKARSFLLARATSFPF
jgi:hypothetical protein